MKYKGYTKTTVKIRQTRLWRYLAENSRHSRVALSIVRRMSLFSGL